MKNIEGGLMQNNPSQEKVISDIYGQIIVIACPGSGKTTTILRRINNMVENEDIAPEEILMITFTKAAAKEMKERYMAQYGKSGVTFCTIHSLCMALLKKFKGFNPKCVMSDNKWLVTDIAYKYAQAECYSDLEAFINDIISDITMIKNNHMELSEYVPACCSNRQVFDRIYNAYESEKKRRGIIDYDDLLISAYRLLQDEAVLNFIRDKYGYIHVDEYQDTSILQKDIIYAIAGQNGNITVVGDDDQSIYSFRGANPEVMQDFQKHYIASSAIYMNTNYRSDKEIINVASKLVSHNTVRFKKDIISSSSDNGSVKLNVFPSKKEEITKLGNNILSMVNHKVSLDNIAILYRTNAQAAQIADVLLKFDIPFYSNEVIPNRYNSEMFHDIMAYYHMSQGKERSTGQDDFIRTITRPNRFFNHSDKMKYTDTAEQMKQISNDSSIPEWKNKNSLLNIEKYHKFLKCLKFLNPASVLDTIYIQGGYREYLQFYAKSRNILFEELEDRWQSYKFDLENKGIKTFDEWERYAFNFTNALQKRQDERKGVCLSTMHKSKGLEWDNVFITGCTEGTVPYRKAVLPLEIEEERRLFYVAMTRAKHNLILSCHKSSGKNGFGKPSRFLTECGLI